LLCRGAKVFHVIGAAYASYFGMLDSEIAKYSSLGRHQLVDSYVSERHKLPTREQLAVRVQKIEASLTQVPEFPVWTVSSRNSRRELLNSGAAVGQRKSD
jgi:hypothetical protein